MKENIKKQNKIPLWVLKHETEQLFKSTFKHNKVIFKVILLDNVIHSKIKKKEKENYRTFNKKNRMKNEKERSGGGEKVLFSSTSWACVFRRILIANDTNGHQ